MAENTPNITAEEWRDIPDWPGYQVSNLGRVRALDRVRHQRMRDGSIQPVNYPARIRRLSACPTTKYLKVGLSRLGLRRTVAVHRLVCEAFHGPRPDRHDVAHGNGNRQDNRAENLRWATRKENRADSIIHGTANVGERNGAAKLTDKQWDQLVKDRLAGTPVRELAATYGLNPSSIYERLRKSLG